MFWYARRDQISWLAALAALVVLLSPLLKYRPALKSQAAEAAVTVQLLEYAEPVEAPRPQPAAVLPRPLPHVEQRPTPSPSPSEQMPLTGPPSPVVVAAPPPVAPAAAAVAAPPPVQQRASVEDGYVAGIRAYLNSIKRYPSGREASIQRPRGKARVWFVLARDGSLLESGIDESSDSLLLDRTALQTVQRGGFPSFPDSAWNGQGSHRFTVELEFIPVG
jgi:protein TonB